MDAPFELQLDGEDRLADPPLLDFFHNDPTADSWTITFVPSDDISDEQNETVIVRKQSSSEARYIQACLTQIQSLVGEPVSIISHLGGGNYTLAVASGATRQLDEFGNGIAMELFDRLRQIAINAELIFRIEHRSANLHQRRPAI